VLRIRDGYPVSSFSSIPDLTSNDNKKEEVEKICWHAFFWVATHFTKLKNIFLKRYNKVLNHFTKNFSNFNPKIVSKLSKIWVGDPGSRKKFPRSDPDQGVKKTHRIPDTDPQHCPDNVQIADATVSYTIAFMLIY
jgi:hypothetical protein